MGMRFAIDVIGLDRNRKVVRLWSNLRPYRLTPIVLGMHSALELPVGTIERAGVEVGSVLSLEEVEALQA